MEERQQGMWKKAISPERDRTQSQALVWIVVPLLVVFSAKTIRHAISDAGQLPAFVFCVIGVSVAFALIVVALRAATTGGAVCGGMICLTVTYWTGSPGTSIGRSGLAPLALLFVLTFVATRAGRQRKAPAEPTEARRGRDAAQVIANLSVAGLCASAFADTRVMKTMCLAALVEATADTMSSEIGQAFGGQPVMIATLRRVVPGTDGAVTIVGSVAGILGGAVVASAGGWAMHLELRKATLALMAGVCGLFFDSVLGASLERRGWLGNDLVNFFSTAFAAGLCFVIMG